VKFQVRRLLRIAFGAVLLYLIFLFSDPRAVAATLRQAHPGPISLAVALVLFDRSLMAYRAMALLCIVEPARRPRFREVMRIFFVSTFVGTFLPSGIGGEAVRAIGLSRRDVRAADAVASVFMDRALGVLSVLMVAVAGLVVARDLLLHPAVQMALLVTTAACAAVVVVVFTEGGSRLARSAISVVPGDRLKRASQSLLSSIQRYAAFRRELALVLLASLGVQMLRIVQTYYLGLALSIPTGFATYFALVPLILLVMMVPLTVYGLGTSQAAFVWFFGTAGVPPDDGFALSVLFIALGVVGNLPGGVLYLIGGLHGRPNLESKRLAEPARRGSWPSPQG
jgi:uncharacterized protein (TIRG00374 family)